MAISQILQWKQNPISKIKKFFIFTWILSDSGRYEFVFTHLVQTDEAVFLYFERKIGYYYTL